MKIQIKSKPFSVTNYYIGVYTKDIGDELEYKEKYYEFTIIEGDNIIDITWCDEIPNNNKEIEQQIFNQFKENL